MPHSYKDVFLKINPDKHAKYAMYKRVVMRMQTFTDIERRYKAILDSNTYCYRNKDVASPEHAVEMYRQIPNASLTILPGGHGNYKEEFTILKPWQKKYPALPMIESFLQEK